MNAARTLIFVSALFVAASAGAQTPPGEADPVQVDPVQVDPPAPIEPQADTMPVPRGALLREGSQVVRVAGRLRRDAPDGPWIFTIEADDPLLPRYELTMMPGSLLSEMERVVQESDDQQLIFEVTGRVFVYLRRNFLMLTHPPLLVAHEPEPEPAESAAPAGDTGGTDDDTDDIIRELERSVGPVARRREADRSSGLVEFDRYGPPLLEGTMLLARRGVVRRSASGTFLLVFDADAEGLADPPMVLLPCLLLERLSRDALKNREPAPVLVSGDVYTYDRQNYLLPTVFRIPRDRTLLTP